MQTPHSLVNIRKINLLAISMLVILITGLQPAQAQDDRIQSGKTCRVTDPTGTPLNARLQPNGKVVNRIKNGRNVYVQSVARDDDDKPWVLVAIKDRGNYKILGYVLREFISCY